MFKIENPEILYGLFLTLPLVILLLYRVKAQKKIISKLGDNRISSLLIPSLSFGKIKLKGYLTILILGLLIFCLANPQLGSEIQKVERKGIDLMIALDISKSMDCEDIQPSRLSRAKQSIIRLLSKMKGDRIGVIIFSSDAFVQLPLTSDYGAAKLFINTITTDDISVQGTAIEKAINLCVENFESNQSKKNNRAILVISDGENHEGDAIAAAKKAASDNIMVCCIGMGSEEGAPIPIYQSNGNLQGYKKDRDGNVVITKTNEKMLMEISKAGNGYYQGTNNTSAGADEIFDKLNKLDKTVFESRIINARDTKFQYILAIAFLFLILEIFIFEKKNKYINHQKLFGDKK